MAGRVIQGFFPGGAMPANLAASLAIQRASPPANRPGPPGLAFARKPAPVQPKAATGRPAPAHQPGSVAQRHGGNGDFTIDPVQVGLARGGGKPLPRPLLAKMEAAFGADFSAVRVHIGPQAARIGAIAFTTGNDLYFAPGRYQPDSVQGQQLIGHELAHVIQQRQGRVRAPGSGVSVVQDHALEAEADRLGMRAAMHRATPVQAKLQHPRNTVGAATWAAGAGRAQPLQRMKRKKVEKVEEDEEKEEPNFADILSDYDDDEADELSRRHNKIIKMKKGDAKQNKRLEAVNNFKHINSSMAFTNVFTVVGIPSQSTGVIYYGDDSQTTVYSTVSSTPLKEYVNTNFGTYGFECDTRALFGTGNHVHAEAFAIYDRVSNDRKLNSNDAIIVNKPVCDICTLVLEGLGIKVADQGSGECIAKHWTNPWSLIKPTSKYEKQIAAAIDVILKKYKRNGGKAVLKYYKK